MRQSLNRRIGAMATATALLSAALSFAQPAHAQASCNPFTTTVRFIVPPLNTLSGNLIVNVNSVGCPAYSGTHVAGLQLAFVQNTSVQDKCELIARGLTHLQLPESGYFSVVDQCSLPTPQVTITDTACPNFAGPVDAGNAGISFVVANDDQTLTGGSQTFLPDYELDEIQPGCATGSGLVNLLGGVVTGVPINPSASASVNFIVDLTPLGGSMLSFLVPTTAPGPDGGLQPVDPVSIVAQGVAGLNGQLQSHPNFGVTCAVIAAHPRAFGCSQPGGATASIEASIQLNDSGLRRMGLSAFLVGANAISALITDGGAPSTDPNPPPAVSISSLSLQTQPNGSVVAAPVAPVYTFDGGAQATRNSTGTAQMNFSGDGRSPTVGTIAWSIFQGSTVVASGTAAADTAGSGAATSPILAPGSGYQVKSNVTFNNNTIICASSLTPFTVPTTGTVTVPVAEGCSCDPSTCPPPSTPAMDGWAVSGLAILLGASGLLAFRKRKAQA